MINRNEPPPRDLFFHEYADRLPVYHFSSIIPSIPIQLFGVNVAEVSDWNRVGDLLSPEEQQRSMLMLNGTSRRYFLAGRALLRSSLAYCLGIRPCDVDLGYSPNGKPYISGTWEGTRLSFNVSHAGGWALIALSSEGDVGVDIEPVVPRKQMHRLLYGLFSDKDMSYVLDAPVHEQESTFYQLWCRREATLKAFGKGARYPTQKLNWSSFNADSNAFRWSPSDADPLRDITLINLNDFGDHKAAVVLVWHDEKTPKGFRV